MRMCVTVVFTKAWLKSLCNGHQVDWGFLLVYFQVGGKMLMELESEVEEQKISFCSFTVGWVWVCGPCWSKSSSCDGMWLAGRSIQVQYFVVELLSPGSMNMEMEEEEEEEAPRSGSRHFTGCWASDGLVSELISSFWPSDNKTLLFSAQCLLIIIFFNLCSRTMQWH